MLDIAQTAAAEESSNITPSTQSQLQPGDRVLGVTRFGAFTSHICLDTAYLRPLPAGWTYEQAAAYPVQTLTAAYGLLELGNLPEGATVLVQSAAGGVGMQALKILHKKHATVLGLVGSQSKADLLTSMFTASSTSVDATSGKPQMQLGTSNASGSNSHYATVDLKHSSKGGVESSTPLNAGISHQGSSVTSSGHAATSTPRMSFVARAAAPADFEIQLKSFLKQHNKPDGFDIVLDSAAGPFFRPSYNSMAPGGRYVIFGAATLTPAPGANLTWNLASLSPANLAHVAKLAWRWIRRPWVDVIALPGDNKAVMGFNLIWLYDKVDLMTTLYSAVEALNLLPPYVGHVYPFAELPEALAFFQSGKSVGKVVVVLHGDDQAGET